VPSIPKSKGQQQQDVERAHITITSHIARFDLVGIVLFAGTACCIVMAISFGGALYAWNSGRIIALLVLATVFCILLCIQQGLCLFTNRADQFFPVHVFKSYEMCILFLQVAAGGASAMIPIFFIPLFFQFVKGDSSLEGGVRLLPYICFLIFGLLVNGAFMVKLKYYLPWFTIGGIFMVTGSSLLYTVHLGTSTSRIYGYTVLLGFGVGLILQTPFAVAQSKVPAFDLGHLTTFITCGQIAGTVFGLAISNSVFINVATDQIRAALPHLPLAEVQSFIAGVGAVTFNSLDPADKKSVLDILVNDIGKVYVMLIAAGALVTVSSMFMKRDRMDGAAGENNTIVETREKN
jgi:hypothetical protein